MHASGRRAFTVVELVIVMLIIGIAATLVLPQFGTTDTARLIMASRLLAADIEFAQSESIAHPDDRRVIKVDQSGNRYWIAKVSDVNTAIADPAGGGTMLVAFGSGRAHELTGVTIQGYALGGDDELRFDAYGQPDQTTTATITLAIAGGTMTVSVASGSGEVTVQ